MGQSSGGDGGGREPGRNQSYLNKQKKKAKKTVAPSNNDKPSDNRPSVPNPPKPKPAINEAVEARIGPSKNLTKSREEKEDVFKTPADFSAGVDKAKNRGPSPGDVMATFGSVGDLNRDTVAANVAGRPGLNVANMGQLATRARVGQLPAGDIKIPGVGSAAINILNTVGKKSATNIMKTIAGDSPKMKDGKVTYGSTIVADKGTGSATSFGNIQGYVKDGRYTGRGDYSPDLTSTGSVIEAKPTPRPDADPDPVASVTKPTQQPAQPKTKPKVAAAVQRAFNLFDDSGGQKLRKFMDRRKDL